MTPTRKDVILEVELYLKEKGLIKEEDTVVNIFFRPGGIEALVDTEAPHTWYTVRNIQEDDLVNWHDEKEH